MIYLDNAATTKVNNEVLKTLNKLYEEYFVNADSPYLLGLNINNLQEKARAMIASLLKVSSNELIFTSCGSEGNNMVIKGVAFKYLNKGVRHIITSSIEHSSVYETMKQLEEFGFEITYLDPNEDGIIENKDILNSIKENTILISIMKVNSELGSVNSIEEVYDEIKLLNKDILIHSDCVQALGKVNIDFTKIDLASFSAHKINGVKGSGLVYKKNNISLIPLISGGQQEKSLRAGTSNYHYNIIFAKTLRIYLEKKDEEYIRYRFNYIYKLLQSNDNISINTPKSKCSMFIINFSLPKYKPEVVLNALEERKIYLSTKSACSSSSKTSRVLSRLKIADENKDSALRISFDLDTSIEDLKLFYDVLDDTLRKVKKGR